MQQEKRMRTLFLMSKGSMYPPVKTGGFIAPSSYPFTLILLTQNPVPRIDDGFDAFRNGETAVAVGHRYPLNLRS